MFSLPKGFVANIGRLMFTPGALIYGALAGAQGFVGRSASVVEPATATGLALFDAVLGIASLFALWWAVRQMAGPAVGQGRGGKWFMLNLVFGMAMIAILVLVGAALNGVVAGDLPEAMTSYPALAIASVASALLLFPWVWIAALAISGDRVSYATITATLRPFAAPMMLAYALAMAFALLPSGFDMMSVVDSTTFDYHGISAGFALLEAVGSALALAVIVAAYLRVDGHHDAQVIADIFG